MKPHIYTVHSRKGGVGKSTIAYELAYLKEAILIDFEYEYSSVTTTWKYHNETPLNRPRYIEKALYAAKAPTVLTGHKPALVPGHPDLITLGMSAEQIAHQIVSWKDQWQTDLVIDTHPGATNLANAALTIADVIIVPTRLNNKDLFSVNQLVTELNDSNITTPVIVMPNFLPRFSVQREKIFTKNFLPIEKKYPNIHIAEGLSLSARIELRESRMPITEQNAIADKKTINELQQLSHLITTIIDKGENND